MGSLRLKRGDSTDRLNYTPLEGELILDTDTQQLFIGDGVTAGGNAVVAGNANVTIVSNYSNSNVASFLPTYTGNITANVITANSVTGISFSNIPAGNLTGTIPSVVLGNSTTYVGTTAIALNRSSAVQDLTGITSIQNGNSNVSITANGNVTVNAVGGARLTAFATGVNVAGTFSVSGNATVDGLTSNTFGSFTGNVTAGNLVTGGRVVATGNVLGDHFVGNAINLTGNISANTFISTATTGTAPFSVLSTTQVANLNAATAGTAVTVTGNAQGNITSVGTLTSLAVTGNIDTANIVNAGGNIKLIAGGAVMLDTSNAGVTLGGNVNITTGGTGLNNLIVAGNVTGNVFSGNGSGLTNLTGANITGTVPSANVADYVQLVPTNANAGTYYIGFTNSATANSQLRTDTDLSYSPSTNTLTVSNITGRATESTLAFNVDIVDATANSFYPILSTEPLLGIGQTMIDPDWPSVSTYLGFNPVTKTFRARNANITANATVGGDLTVTGNLNIGEINANVATYVTTQAANTTGTTQYVTFVGSNLDAQDQRIKTDNGLGYVPSTNTLSAANISANNLYGAISTASQTGITSVGTLTSLTVTNNIATTAGVFAAPPTTKTGTSTGTAGQIVWDANYIYVCTATNVWKRVSLTAF